jgi:hypothetical protein
MQIKPILTQINFIIFTCESIEISCMKVKVVGYDFERRKPRTIPG